MRRFAIVLAVISLTGCAAAFKGSKQEVRIASYPDKVDMRIDGRYMGQAPATLELDRDRDQYIKVSREGYAPQTLGLKHRNDTPWFVWDIATCVIPIMLCIPIVVDAVSGSWFSFDDEYKVKLEPVSAGAAPPAAPMPPAPEKAPAPAVSAVPASSAGY